jgi:hypothetical protein
LEEHLDLECVFDGCTKELEHIKERSEEYSLAFNKDVVVYSQHRRINNIGLVACRIHYNIKLVDFVVEHIFDIFYFRKSVDMEGEGETHTKVSKRSVSCIGTP